MYGERAAQYQTQGGRHLKTCPAPCENGRKEKVGKLQNGGRNPDKGLSASQAESCRFGFLTTLANPL